MLQIIKNQKWIYLITLLLVLLNIYLFRNGYLMGYKYHELSFLLRRTINLTQLITFILTPFSAILNSFFDGGKPFFTPISADIAIIIGIIPSIFFYNLIIIGFKKWRNKGI